MPSVFVVLPSPVGISVAEASALPALPAQPAALAEAPALLAQQPAFTAASGVTLTASVFAALRAFLSDLVSWAVEDAIKATTAMRVNRMRMIVRGFKYVKCNDARGSRVHAVLLTFVKARNASDPSTACTTPNLAVMIKTSTDRSVRMRSVNHWERKLLHARFTPS